MKYNGFKIFKFSTISKMNNRIRDGFSRIDKNIKKVPNYVVNLFSYIIKYVFSGIYKESYLRYVVFQKFINI